MGEIQLISIQIQISNVKKHKYKLAMLRHTKAKEQMTNEKRWSQTNKYDGQAMSRFSL